MTLAQTQWLEEIGFEAVPNSRQEDWEHLGEHFDNFTRELNLSNGLTDAIWHPRQSHWRDFSPDDDE